MNFTAFGILTSRSCASGLFLALALTIGTARAQDKTYVMKITTAEVARKCSALAANAYPPLVPGNPAAGRAGGNGHAVRKYFNRCVANGGHMHKHSSDNPSGKH